MSTRKYIGYIILVKERGTEKGTYAVGPFGSEQSASEYMDREFNGASDMSMSGPFPTYLPLAQGD